MLSNSLNVIKIDRNVKELWQIVCRNILLVILVNFVVLLCETFINVRTWITLKVCNKWRCALRLLILKLSGAVQCCNSTAVVCSYHAAADVFYAFRGNALLPSWDSKCTFPSYLLRPRKGVRCSSETSERAHLDTVSTLKSRINVS